MSVRYHKVTHWLNVGEGQLETKCIGCGEVLLLDVGDVSLIYMGNDGEIWGMFCHRCAVRMVEEMVDE
jgi:hypothetical protein